jgi:hypothetical protein
MIRLADAKLTQPASARQAPVSFAAHEVHQDGRIEELGP